MQPATTSPRARATAYPIIGLALLLYLAEGFPYGLINELAPIYLRVHHVPLPDITAWLSTIAFAWTLKFFWSPLIELGAYKRWIAGALATMTLLLASIATAPQQVGTLFWFLLALIAIASATQDIAIDAFTIRITPKELLGPVNAIRVIGYRGAILVAGGGLAVVAQAFGWRAAFASAAAVTALLMLLSLWMPNDRASVNTSTNLLDGIAQWLKRSRAFTLLAIVLLYRLGEFAIVPVIKPYWVDCGYSIGEVGTVTTTIGVLVTIAGVGLGGGFIARYGLYAGMIWMGIAQCVSNIGYGVAAATHGARWSIYTASVLENLGFGLGTASFLAFLMFICDKERAATEYALLTALFGVSRWIMGAASGKLAAMMGYGPYFWLSVALGLPALLLLPKVKELLTVPSVPSVPSVP